VTCAVAGVVELLVARPARCARVVEPARWSGWMDLRVDGWGDTLRCGRAASEL